VASERNGGDLGFEAELFKAADSLRGNLEPSEYKHIVLGLIFLKYISEAFEAQRAKLKKEQFADPDDPEEYLAARVFWCRISLVGLTFGTMPASVILRSWTPSPTQRRKWTSAD